MKWATGVRKSGRVVRDVERTVDSRVVWWSKVCASLEEWVDVVPSPIIVSSDVRPPVIGASSVPVTYMISRSEVETTIC